MTISEWDEAIKELNKEGQESILEAVTTLLEWDVFNREFKGLGIDTLQVMLKFITKGNQ